MKAIKLKILREYTSEEIATLRATYPNGVAAAKAALPGRSTKSIRTKALSLGLQVSKETISALRSEMNACRIVKKKDATPELPPEYIKVSSIWRVGQRYAAQVQA